MPFVLQWLIGDIAFQSEVSNGAGEGVAQNDTKNPAADPMEEDEAPPQVDIPLETTEGGHTHDDNGV
jgi:hypothetical protein